MCGRYTLSDPGDLLAELDVNNRESLAPRYNIAPTQDAAVVRAGEEGRELAMLHWGLIPFWAKEASIGNRMINARAETVAEKPSFRNALRKRRCLVLTDGFYEWRKMGSVKQPYHIHFEGRKSFVFAGLWESWDKDPEIGLVESFTIITTEAHESVRELHHRMPVILDGEARNIWLDPNIDDKETLTALLQPHDGLDFVAVNRMVGNPRNDYPECLERVEI